MEDRCRTRSGVRKIVETLMDEGRRGYRVPLTFFLQPEGGFTVTSPAIPELITEGDTIDEAVHNVQDAMSLVVEMYEREGRTLPTSIMVCIDGPVEAEQLLAVG
jgi:antitoxin HicB